HASPEGRHATAGPTPGSSAQSATVRHGNPLRGPAAHVVHRVGAQEAPPSAPHSDASPVHGSPSNVPPSHARYQRPGRPHAHSTPAAHARPAPAPPSQMPRTARRLIRSTVYAASADPKSFSRSTSPRSDCCSNNGGSFRPSGENDSRKARPGT